jgi:glyoxylase-like metal-dependent hydrolase (beta-lactamase superfamily II)
VAYRRLRIVNVVFVGRPGAGDWGWALVNAGSRRHEGLIRAAAEKRFGKTARPAAFVMTYGHFDHSGALEALAAK